ncbi:MAG: 4-phosphoerythronate dehydrogenase [Kiritimatiellae bacterium]|nr:4-phosphoerythronate dehydrogenase [Kiritimatiellia bacterium]MDW8458132.1 4-phosphoerythronate dehydrogenase [Verrucomicrobiota bacterium]
MTRIVCATSVALGREAFSTLGEVVCVPEQEISPEIVRNADLLITRSKVRVGPSLLEGSRVSFVATATAGFDHIDTDYLSTRGIAWTAAPGCNAHSVAEWVVAALLELHAHRGVPLEGSSIGIIGVGNVGSRVAALAPALGLAPLLNDPPRAALEPGPQWLDLRSLLSRTDIITLHVPLTDTGEYATREMVNCRFLEDMRPGSILINASRGEVVDEDCLLLALEKGWLAETVLDVYENEPAIDPRVVRSAFLATPHIAGYSYEGRVRGTIMCYEEACRFLEVEPRWSPPVFTSEATRTLYVDPRGRSDLEALHDVVSQAYNIRADDTALRNGMDLQPEERRAHFQRLRAQYPDRREFPSFKVRLAAPAPSLEERLRVLGFQVDPH